MKYYFISSLIAMCAYVAYKEHQYKRGVERLQQAEEILFDDPQSAEAIATIEHYLSPEFSSNNGFTLCRLALGVASTIGARGEDASFAKNRAQYVLLNSLNDMEIRPALDVLSRILPVEPSVIDKAKEVYDRTDDLLMAFNCAAVFAKADACREKTIPLLLEMLDIYHPAEQGSDGPQVRDHVAKLLEDMRDPPPIVLKRLEEHMMKSSNRFGALCARALAKLDRGAVVRCSARLSEIISHLDANPQLKDSRWQREDAESILRDLYADLPFEGKDTFPYSASEGKSFRLIQNCYPKLKIGMHLGRVKKLCGNPDIEQTLKSKEGGSLGISYSYFINVKDIDAINEKQDQFYSVFFSPQNRVVKVAVYNIPGLVGFGE